MKSIFNIVIISLFSIATLFSGTTEEKLALEAQNQQIAAQKATKLPSLKEKKINTIRSIGEYNGNTNRDCSDCEFDWTAYGAECCDSAWEEDGIDCMTLEANYNWDCSGCLCPGDEEGECGDGTCNISEDCETCEADCGVCGECDAGFVTDCVDNDCCSETWIGDGFADCEDQAFGCDLTCYDDDGGDCADPVCGDDLCNGDETYETCPDDCSALGSECTEDFCDEGTYWDGNTCYDCGYCLDTNDDSACEAPFDCCGACGGSASSECAPEEPCGDETACNYGELEDCAFESDCLGECGGTTEVDCTGVCGGTTEVDCTGVCGGTAAVDACGVCGGDGSTCADCPYPNWISDGYCDSLNNITECNYDGGDCCPGDCVDATYSCETNGGTCADCIDPDSADNAEGGDCTDTVMCEDPAAYNYGQMGDCLYVPDGWTCEDSYAFDTWCDCGCGAYDSTCDDPEAQGFDNCDPETCVDPTSPYCGEPESWDAEITGLTAEGVEDDYDTDGVIDSAVQWTWDALLDGTSCEENGQVTCSDGSCAASEEDCPEPSEDCADCEFDWTAYGAECCDTAWDTFGIDCATLEGTYGWDCSGCTCPGDASPECGDGNCTGDETFDSCPEDCSGCQGNESWIADGWCDSVNNNDACGFDGGDCCPTSCAESVANDCPDNPTGCYTTGTGSCGDCTVCDDPNSVDNAEGGDCEGRSDNRRMVLKDKVLISPVLETDTANPTIVNIATGEIIQGASNGNRAVSYTINVSCSACIEDENGDIVDWSGSWDTDGTEFLIYGFFNGDEACANVVGNSTEYGSTDPSADVCANAGAGESCTPGDASGDGNVDILDLVAIAGYILSQDTDPANHPCADYDEDGTITILDLVSIVSYILGGGGRDIDATSATMKIDDGSLSIVANGSVDGIQMTLSHGADFAIDLMDNALLAEYKTTGNQTILIVLRPEGEEIFTSQGDFEVVEVIAANSSGMVDVIVAPATFALSSAYPNPFNPTTSLELSVPANGQVTVQVYNLMGQVVSTLANGYMDANTYTLTWDASNVSSGMYIVKAEAAGTVSTQKLMLMK